MEELRPELSLKDMVGLDRQVRASREEEACREEEGECMWCAGDGARDQSYWRNGDTSVVLQR